MYVDTDPRARLASAPSAKPAATQAPANYARFYADAPQLEKDGVRTWYARAQNFVTAYSEFDGQARFERAGQPDEYMVLLPDPSTNAIIFWNGQETEVRGHSVIFIPPGDSHIEVSGGGSVVRFFTTAAHDMVDACPRGYVEDPNVPALVAWPEPVGGYKVRSYSMDVQPTEGRFGRIFRSTNFMINYVYPRSGPRDRATLSPHSHADFQQCSLSLEGTYIHHLRWPWGPDANQWRADDHEICHSPSVTIIPAQVIHTSEAAGEQSNTLVDVFCPPRVDFSRQPGWVLNAEDYPEPTALRAGSN